MSPETYATLRRELAGRDVLSVYIDAEEHDPNERASWRLRLRQSLNALQDAIAPDDAAAFEAAREAVEVELKGYTGFLPGRGWVLFATADGLYQASREAVPLPERVVWRRGPVLGPLTRALRQDRAVTVALIDSLRARLFRYANGRLDEQVDQRADSYIDDLTDRNMSKRAATASGMRGATATDQAERILRASLERHARSVAASVLAASRDGLVIAGGPTLAVTELRKILEPALGERLHVDDTLHLAMTEAQLIGSVEQTASHLSARLQEISMRRLLDAAVPGGAVALGASDVQRAVGLGQVDRLYLTPSFLNERDLDAEEIIATALDRGGTVELVSGEGAALLDAMSNGAGARLRYAPGVAGRAEPAAYGPA